MRMFAVLFIMFSFSIAMASQAAVTGPSARLIVTNSSAVPSQNIGVNIPNQVLGGFEVDNRGNPVSVQQTLFRVDTRKGSGTIPILENVEIRDSADKVVAGPVDLLTVIKESPYLTFTDTIIFPPGKSTYRILGRVVGAEKNGNTVALTTNPSSDWKNALDQETGKSITLTSGSFDMNTMTVKSGALTMSVTQHTAEFAVPGTTGHTFATYHLDTTQSGEDVQLSELYFTLTTSGKAGGDPRDVTNMQLWDGTTCLTTGRNVVNPHSMNATGEVYRLTMDRPLSIPKGVIKALALKGNISSVCPVGATFSCGLGSGQNISVTGLNSSNDIPETIIPSPGQTTTVAGPPMPMISQEVSTQSLALLFEQKLDLWSPPGPPERSALTSSQLLHHLLSKQVGVEDTLMRQLAQWHTTPPGMQPELDAKINATYALMEAGSKEIEDILDRTWDNPREMNKDLFPFYLIVRKNRMKLIPAYKEFASAYEKGD